MIPRKNPFDLGPPAGPQEITPEMDADLLDQIKKIPELSSASEVVIKSIHEASREATKRHFEVFYLKAYLIEHLDLPTKKRAEEIARCILSPVWAFAKRDKTISRGFKSAIWRYSGAPCAVDAKRMTTEDIERTEAHKAAEGKEYDLRQGLFVQGIYTWPRRAPGCKCFSATVIEGFT